MNNLVKSNFPKFTRQTVKKDIFTTEELNALFNEALWQKLNQKMYEKEPQFDDGYIALYLMFLCAISFGLRLGEAIELAGETVRKIAGHNSMAMTDYYTRGAIPELVEAVKPAADAANRLFE